MYTEVQKTSKGWIILHIQKKFFKKFEAQSLAPENSGVNQSLKNSSYMDFSFHKISIQDRKFSKFLSFPNLRPNLRPQDFKASVAEAEAEFSKSSAFGRPLVAIHSI